MKKIIYAEWKYQGKFENGFFRDWGHFHNETFSPDYEVLTAKEINEPDHVSYYKGIPETQQ